MHVDITGKEIKVGQQVVVPTLGPTELYIGTVTKLTPKKIKVESEPPIFVNEAEEEKWWDNNFTLDGTWFPESVYIIQ